MNCNRLCVGIGLFVGLLTPVALVAEQPSDELRRVQFNHPGLVVDLGVGLWAWPLPMDWDSDGDYDLIVSCPDKPYNGTYLFENPDGAAFPVFLPGVKVGPGLSNVQVSHVAGVPRVLHGAEELVDFLGGPRGFESAQRRPVYPRPQIHEGTGRARFNIWSYVDYDDDGAIDILVGVDDWGDYGWDDGFDGQGQWKRGPLHGYVYLIRNSGTSDVPQYEPPIRLHAGGHVIDTYGNPQPNLADFDGDGDQDLICGEFLDGLTFFQNVGTRSCPRFEAGHYLTDGLRPVRMHVQMITPTAIDWDRDGDVDIVCGDEDGRVALIENIGLQVDGRPAFRQPRYFQQIAGDVKFGALVTPVSYDWDADGDEDLICGNTSGNIGWIENLDGGDPPRWAAPVLLSAGGKTIHIQAGGNGSIQGPAEAKWGYTTLSVADWNHDGLTDLLVNSIWGRVIWYRNEGTESAPRLAEAESVKVAWRGDPPSPAWTWWKPNSGELATQWRTTPVAVDWDLDGLVDLIMLDHEGYLTWFRRTRQGGQLVLFPGQRVFRGGDFDSKHQAFGNVEATLRLNRGTFGGSGRRKLCIVDWDGDGRRDLLVNSVNANWLRNQSSDGPPWVFRDMGPLSKQVLAGHTTSPTTADWDRDGIRDLLLGAEDGHIYHLRNPR